MAEAGAGGPIDEDGDELRFLNDMTGLAGMICLDPPDPGRVALAALEWEGREHDEWILLPFHEVEQYARLLGEYFAAVAGACNYLTSASSQEEPR